MLRPGLQPVRLSEIVDQSAGMAAFIIKWVSEEDASEEKAVALLAEILLQISVKLPKQLSQSAEPAK